VTGLRDGGEQNRRCVIALSRLNGPLNPGQQHPLVLPLSGVLVVIG